MCAEDLKTSSPALKRMGLPIVFGVTIEIACDLLKHVVRYFRTSIYFDVGHGLWRELTDADIWIGLGFAILLVVLSIWVLDAWKWADPRRPVRTGLLLISVILTGILSVAEAFVQAMKTLKSQAGRAFAGFWGAADGRFLKVL